jgi:hypothetical protein
MLVWSPVGAILNGVHTPTSLSAPADVNMERSSAKGARPQRGR